ncbi:DUF4190 domain-containing protein [Cellulomonas sp. McL0617]|uniref:DUF4190 domain-containing protein n=1 Tax=Cellulomonas sp. McL0617 TaxID=3415675 RepID=UPI003CE91915
MSNEPGGPAPLPEPYVTPVGREPDRRPTPPTPSGYEATLPPPAPYVAAVPAHPDPAGPGGQPATVTNPFLPPTAGGQATYGTPPAAQPAYGPPPTGSPYGQVPGYGQASPYGQAPAGGSFPAYGQAPTYGQAPAYGQAPPYGAPYGSPYGGTPYGPGPGYPYAAPRTEPLAIGAMVTSIVGLVVLGGLACPVGLGLGIAALRRVRRNGTQGRGLAIAGIAVGGVGTLYLIGVIAIVVAVITGSLTTYDDSTFDTGTNQGNEQQTNDTVPDYTLRSDLLVGDCLDVYPFEWDMSDASVVSCAVPHEGEVVAMVTMTGPSSTSTSGDDPVWDLASQECDQRATELLGDDVDLGEIDLYAPHPNDFASGGTTAYCTFFSTADGGLFTGSAVEHTLTAAPPTGSET